VCGATPIPEHEKVLRFWHTLTANALDSNPTNAKVKKIFFIFISPLIKNHQIYFGGWSFTTINEN
jgi:hypothetical protein